MPHSAVSDLGLHCLFRHICPNAGGKCSIYLDRGRMNIRSLVDIKISVMEKSH